MSQYRLSNQFLERTISAVADGYCSMNLTHNVVQGVLHQVIDGVDHDLNERMGLPEDAAFEDVVSVWAQTLTDEERPAFRIIQQRQSVRAVSAG